jgi:hypothetical protein
LNNYKDAEWLADLLKHGLLKASFVQKRAGRELKELVRYKNSIVEERAREYNRLDKVLQGANINADVPPRTARIRISSQCTSALLREEARMLPALP